MPFDEFDQVLKGDVLELTSTGKWRVVLTANGIPTDKRRPHSPYQDHPLDALRFGYLMSPHFNRMHHQSSKLFMYPIV